MNENGKLSVNEGVVGQHVTVRCQYRSFTAEKTFTVSYDNQLTIECASNVTGVSGNAVALYNSATVQPEWSIIDGGQFIQIGQDGAITVTASGDAVV